MFKLLELIVRAQKSRNKKPLLYELDTQLQVLKTKVRLAAELSFLPAKKYGNLSERLTEIGKMLGGWIKKC